MNNVKQDLLHKKQVLKEGISIDANSGPPRSNFDAVVIFVTSQTLLFRLALAIYIVMFTIHGTNLWLIHTKVTFA